MVSAGTGAIVVALVMFVAALTLVGAALNDSIDRARNGSTPRRRVPDLVILGWSDQVFTLRRAFATAHEGRSAQ